MSTEIGIPEDVSHRFSPVTFNDHAGQLWIVTILSLIYSALVATARAYIKYKMFGFDDILIALATTLHLAQAIAVFVGLSNGLGKFNSITSPEQWATSSKSTLASVILCFLSLSLAKCSILALVLRIIGTKTGKNRIFCIGLMVTSAVWGIGSSVAFLVNCRADTLLTPDNVEQCPSQVTRWAIVSTIDMLTEIFTWLLVVQLSWSVSMSFARKCQVAMAFSFRLPLIALSAIHLAYFTKYPDATEPQFAITNSLLFQQTMLAWSLISATVPNLKNFLKSFSIGMGFPLAFDLSVYGSSNVYALQSLGNDHSRVTTSTPGGAGVTSTSVRVHHHSDNEPRGRPHNWRPDPVSTQTTATNNYGNNIRDNISEEGESSRTGSQEMIINKEVAWQVTYEGQSAR
ncbi:hypothetical protein CEP52_007853 [Fusarium oligoseptatum]|uniref:Rhodopsin domain-containing protein n=1 Tax=Fusarium oligoseptatum TaxID=2604345 RepID=A0A428TKU1_9HYPO|nr:hypothetical protein CEP52_007853 [Fusarium oligoseptatum]